MKGLLPFIAVCALTIVAPSARAADLSATAALVSDYRWRGVSLSDGEPSQQFDLTLSNDAGVWLWGGANSVSESYGDSELGLGFGITRGFADIDWTFGVQRYAYPGASQLDYTQVGLSAVRALGPISLSAGVDYAPRQDNLAQNDVYAWFGWEICPIERVKLTGHVGRDEGAWAPSPGAVDFSLGAAATAGALELGFDYVGVEDSAPAWVFRLAYSG